ncbi:MAG: D-sedoheptulose 7-phosphate isomerase [Bacteriovoracaceae bacterium]
METNSTNLLKNDPDFFKKYVDMVKYSLDRMETTFFDGAARGPISNEIGMETWCKWTEEMKVSGGTMYFIGNGASSTMASHMSADATKNGQLRSKTFNDQSLLTAISNDIDYKEVYALPVERFGNVEDVLVTISSSGNSPNIIRAIEEAHKIGMKVVTLSGMKENNDSRKNGDLNFWIPADFYGVVESSHQTVLHSWLDRYLHNEGRMI